MKNSKSEKNKNVRGFYTALGISALMIGSACYFSYKEGDSKKPDISSDSIYVRFELMEAQKLYEKAKINSQNKLYSIIWTTTPWTIPSNNGICLNARFEYTIFTYFTNYK